MGHPLFWQPLPLTKVQVHRNASLSLMYLSDGFIVVGGQNNPLLNSEV